ncbi:LacI family DNA-binding transcriptional regulator [Paenibacillus allorhizosphaerae]|uniref:Catabolite control protein A n=1 Tax=Paenibacillus allorhizosphaerae TaxID=2849866 RepID=A0ABN7TR19_9BACL|nr:LacI family DNA-binding transcriptional regulator [Paenibacillus allorhizosphaerae]CAG7647369.1 Catabolite control protein A [Paenibacillus allorhizosphaerae]
MSSKRQVTIVDIAEAAGVSIATVSNVLNRRNVPMSEDTIRKVEEVAERLGYRRNVMAANLSRRKTYELGMLVPGFGGYYGRFAEEMQRKAHLYGYHLSVFSAAGFDPEIEQRHLEVLLQRRVDGLFCHGLAMSHETTRKIVGEGTPLVLFNGWGWPSDIAVCAVNLDFAGGCIDAVRHLYDRGSRKLYYFGKAAAHATDRQRRIGFAEGVRRLPEAVASEIVEFRDSKSMDQLMDEVVAEAKSDERRPVGILAFDDNDALAIMSAVFHRGYRVPDDYLIVGINNDPVSKLAYPSLTTIDIPYQEQVRLAIRLMLLELGETERLKQVDGDIPSGFSTNEQEIRIPLQLIPRMSTLGR